MANEMTAFTFLGENQFKKYTQYLPLAGKEYEGIVQWSEQQSLKLCDVGSNPSPLTNNMFNLNKNQNEKVI